MEIKKLSYSKEIGRYHLSGTNPSYINTIRRIVTNKLPIMAIDTITFIENGSALYDEIVANRLGLVPLTMDSGYVEPSKCKCKGAGCAKCQLKMTINKAGPCIVYAEDIKSSDPSVKAVHPKMSVVKLLKDQTLKLEIIARLGIGKEHAKFSPGHVFFQGYPGIKIKQAVKDAKMIAEQCPKKILKADGSKLKVTDEEMCDLCHACTDISEDISVKGSDTDFILTIESWGQLSVKDIFARALEVFDDELEELEQEIKDIK